MASNNLHLTNLNEVRNVKINAGESGIERPASKNSKLRETELDVEILDKDSGEDFGGVDDGLLPPPRRNPSPEPRRPDINLYQQKKTLAQGMMDVALLTANANQLRIALERKSDDFYVVNVVLISLSIVIQIVIGVCLIWNSSYNVNKGTQLAKANRVNNVTIIGIFVVTVLNVFISAFGISTGSSALLNDSTALIPK